MEEFVREAVPMVDTLARTVTPLALELAETNTVELTKAAVAVAAEAGVERVVADAEESRGEHRFLNAHRH